jgi:hypothetical protein
MTNEPSLTSAENRIQLVVNLKVKAKELRDLQLVGADMLEQAAQTIDDMAQISLDTLKVMQKTQASTRITGGFLLAISELIRDTTPRKSKDIKDHLRALIGHMGVLMIRPPAEIIDMPQESMEYPAMPEPSRNHLPKGYW